MELALKMDCVKYFESKMGELAPWMHSYKFSDDIIVGYFKYEGLGENLTWINSSSAPSDIQKMRRAYALRQEDLSKKFFSKIIDHIPIQKSQMKNMCVLDISSATGKNSLYAINEGFGKVIASEIRKNQCDQFQMILNCIEEEKYKRSIVVVNDPTSADLPVFPERYLAEDRPDIVLSFGLLYHLTNPLQHILNIHKISKKYAVIYTMTHYQPLADRAWLLAIENPDWITKAVGSVCWIPHFLEVKRLCENVGFKNVQIVYPDCFEKNFPDFKHYTRSTKTKLIWQKLIHRFLKIRTGMLKNQDFSFFQYMGLNPNYFAYICEK